MSNYSRSAFPGKYENAIGLTKLEYFLANSPWEPDKSDIDAEIARDRNKNPHNDSHKPRIRGYAEIVIDLKINNALSILKITESI
jgi:hypothetical protein